MKLDVVIRNRQRTFRVDGPRLRELGESLLARELEVTEASLGIHLIGSGAMASMNWQWLRHTGSTDILTFDHRTGAGEPLHGELFISLGDAAEQAALFGTTPDLELARYVIHGVLHLMGYDDRDPAARKVMKREENRLLRRLTAKGGVAGLVRPSPGAAGLELAGKRSR